MRDHLPLDRAPSGVPLPAPRPLGQQRPDLQGDARYVLRRQSIPGQEGNRPLDGRNGFPSGFLARILPQAVGLCDEGVRHLSVDDGAKCGQLRFRALPGRGPLPFLQGLHRREEPSHASVGIGDRLTDCLAERIPRISRLLLSHNADIFSHEKSRIAGGGPDHVEFMEIKP